MSKITSKQKDIRIDSVPRSYFTELQNVSKRAIGKKVNTLLDALLKKDKNDEYVLDEKGEYILDESFKMMNYDPLISPFEYKPRIYGTGVKALELATKKFSKDGKKITELDIINQVFYQDFHNKRK